MPLSLPFTELESIMLRNRLDIDGNLLRRNVYFLKNYKSIALVPSYSKASGEVSKYIPRFITGDLAKVFILYTAIVKPIVSVFDAIVSLAPCTPDQVEGYMKESSSLDYLFTTPYGRLMNGRNIRWAFVKGFKRFYHVDFTFSEYRQVM
jgi:hypothetical protein